MSHVRVWIHAVWGTKNREPVPTGELRHRLINHIIENSQHKVIFIDRLNGVADHLHCLLGLNADISIAQTMQLIKGESSFWVNNTMKMPTRSEWANEYYAASVSESGLVAVRAYIDNQEAHHRRIAFAAEVERFMRLCGPGQG